MFKKSIVPAAIVAVLCFGLVMAACNSSKSAAPTIKIDKDTYAPGETINVTYSTPTALPENAWIGIIPSGIPHGDEATNDGNDLTYQYLNKSTSGVMTFSAPTVPGSYDLRMNDSDNSGKEVASVTFVVK